MAELTALGLLWSSVCFIQICVIPVVAIVVVFHDWFSKIYNGWWGMRLSRMEFWVDVRTVCVAHLWSHWLPGDLALCAWKRFTILENIIDAEKLLRILYTPSIALRTSNNTHHLLQPLKIIIFLDEECEAKEVFHSLSKFPWLLNNRTRPKTLVFWCQPILAVFWDRSLIKKL